MLESPCIRRYSFTDTTHACGVNVSSDNPTGADNQQETAEPLELDAHWHVYQHHAHREVLEALIRFFGCGVIRAKGPKRSVLTYAVGRRSDLERVIVPF